MLSHLLVTPGVRDQNFVVLTLYRAPVVLRTISYGVGNFCAVKCLKHNLETLHFTFFCKKSRNLKVLPSCKCCQRTVVGNNRRCREYSRDVNIRFVGIIYIFIRNTLLQVQFSGATVVVEVELMVVVVVVVEESLLFCA